MQRNLPRSLFGIQVSLTSKHMTFPLFSPLKIIHLGISLFVKHLLGLDRKEILCHGLYMICLT